MPKVTPVYQKIALGTVQFLQSIRNKQICLEVKSIVSKIVDNERRGFAKTLGERVTLCLIIGREKL